jgi:hypothetical protein
MTRLQTSPMKFVVMPHTDNCEGDQPTFVIQSVVQGLDLGLYEVDRVFEIIFR